MIHTYSRKRNFKVAATKLKSNRDDDDFPGAYTPPPKFTTNSIVMEEAAKEKEEKPIQHTAPVIKADRDTTRDQRVIRISKVPKTTNTFRIQSVTSSHEVVFKDTTYAEAIEISKKTGIVINQS